MVDSWLREYVLVPIGWVGCLHFAGYEVGTRVLRLLDRDGHRGTNRTAEAVLALAAGIAILANVGLLLAIFQLLHSWLLIGLGLTLGGAGLLRIAPHRWRPTDGLRVNLEAVPGIVAVLCVFAFLPNALSPVLAHDENVYHLLIPRLYLEEHALAVLPFNLYANMPHLVEVLYVWPLAIGDITAPKLLSFSFHFWILAGIHAFVFPRMGRLASGIAMLMYVSGKNVQWHLGVANVETTIGLFLLAGIHAFLAWRETGNRLYLHLVGVFSGFVFASKYSAWFYAMPLVVTTVLAIARSNASRRCRWRDASVVLLICAGVLLPWLIKNVVVTGNPIYPNLYRLLDGRHWSAIQEMHYLRSQSYAGGAAGYLESLPLVPLNLAVRDHVFYSPSFSIALMGAFLLALMLRSSYHPPNGYLIGMVLAGFLGWAFSVRQGRFLVAWVPSMTLVGSLALIRIRRHSAALWTLTAIVVLLGVYQFAWQRPGYAPSVKLLLGQRRELVLENEDYALCQFLNATVPPSGRVLIMWDNSFFFLRRSFYADSAYEAPSVLAWLRARGDPDAFARELNDLGFTHVVINTRYMHGYITNGLAFDLLDEELYPAAALDRDRRLLDAFITRWLDQIGRWDATLVFRLKGAPA